MTERDQYPSEKQDRFIVRLPDGMRDRIKTIAAENNRSMNAEIVATLEEKYPTPDRSEIETIYENSLQMIEFLRSLQDTKESKEIFDEMEERIRFGFTATSHPRLSEADHEKAKGALLDLASLLNKAVSDIETAIRLGATD